MNGNSTIAWRDYDRAVERLKAISAQLATQEGRDAVLAKIIIGLPRDLDSSLPGIRAVAAALGEAIKGDVPKYLADVLDGARADVRAKADDLVTAIKADLQSHHMKKS